MTQMEREISQTLDDAISQLDTTLHELEAETMPGFDLRRYAKANPWQSVAAAVAVGFVIGMVL
ncbi:MAG: hypothetical protein MUD01_12660 [Chloroflexaceae bacterium]|jgi:ElaB/YqjD/DUF883 family membrane-anchored ribosome-binding protein|nr:hypothetical protein [Chloroflexaceae bacterium]